jgi:hypothetical protein
MASRQTRWRGTLFVIAFVALHAAAPAAGSLLRSTCTYHLRSPPFPLDAPPPPLGSAFVAATLTRASCAPSRSHATPARRRTPTVALHPAPKRDGDGDADADPFALLLTLSVPSACAAELGAEALGVVDAADGAPASLPLSRVLPRGGWLHMAGDSLLRGEFHALATYLKRGMWEPWAGVAAHRAVFHHARSLCCDDVEHAASEPSGCAYALHAEHDHDALFAAARAGLAAGRTCVTFAFLTQYADITPALAALRASSSATAAAASANASAALPTRVITSAALHSMRTRTLGQYDADVAAFLAEASQPAWADTAFAMHSGTAPNYTCIAAYGHPQTQPVVLAFNAVLHAALRAEGEREGGAWAGGRPARQLPSLVNMYAVTRDAPARFPYKDPARDALHFHDVFYQTAFVVDALVLSAAACARHAALAEHTAAAAAAEEEEEEAGGGGDAPTDAEGATDGGEEGGARPLRRGVRRR